MPIYIDLCSTCTGTLLGTFDALLGIVAQHKGDYFAQLCASHLLMTSPQSLNPVLPMYRNHCDEAVLQVQDWLDEHCAEENRIADLAQQFNFSERNLKRRFQLAKTNWYAASKPVLSACFTGRPKMAKACRCCNTVLVRSTNRTMTISTQQRPARRPS